MKCDVLCCYLCESEETKGRGCGEVLVELVMASEENGISYNCESRSH